MYGVCGDCSLKISHRPRLMVATAKDVECWPEHLLREVSSKQGFDDDV